MKPFQLTVLSCLRICPVSVFSVLVSQSRKLKVVVSIPVYKHDGKCHQMSELNFIEIFLCFIWMVACKHHSRALGALANAMRGGFIRRLAGWSRMPF